MEQITGLDIFKNHFIEHKHKYVLIGGSACHLNLQEQGLSFGRKTKDLDIVPKASLVWKRNDDGVNSSNELCGCYVLRTNKEDLTADELWHMYISLTRAEDGFCYLKSDLGLRPNFHQLEKRVDAHIFITILAYQLLCFVQRSLENAGDNRSWAAIKRVVQTHGYATIVLPTKSGTVYRIRKPGVADLRQRAIYESLGINLSQLPTTRTVCEAKSGAIL